MTDASQFILRRHKHTIDATNITPYESGRGIYYVGIEMDERPTHPQGIGQHFEVHRLPTTNMEWSDLTPGQLAILEGWDS